MSSHTLILDESFYLLLQVVDRSLEVMDAYHERIQRLEKITLLKPKMSTVRACVCVSIMVGSVPENKSSTHHLWRSNPPQTYNGTAQTFGLWAATIRPGSLYSLSTGLDTRHR